MYQNEKQDGERRATKQAIEGRKVGRKCRKCKSRKNRREFGKHDSGVLKWICLDCEQED